MVRLGCQGGATDEARASRPSGGALIQDTFVAIENDFPDDVFVKLFFVNGDPPLDEIPGVERAHTGWNHVDTVITATDNQPGYWSALTGQGTYVVPEWEALDPGEPPGRPAMDGTTDRVLRGFIYACLRANIFFN